MGKANMKKVLLYTFAAVVLGVGIMLFPSWMYFTSRNETGPITFTNGLYIRQVPESLDTPKMGEPDVRTKPADTSLQILAVGFIVATVVYILAKRRVRRPTYLETYRIPPL